MANNAITIKENRNVQEALYCAKKKKKKKNARQKNDRVTVSEAGDEEKAREEGRGK